MRTTVGLFVVGACVAMVSSVPVWASKETPENRRVIDLDGTWQVAEGTMDLIPERFEHKVSVPGLIDMAEPAFAEVGDKSEKRQAFWYRRTFIVKGAIPAVAVLKVHKARYGTKVWLNGQLVGEHLPCFTPALLDVKPQLKGAGQENELVIRVGADRGCLPAGQPTGWDFEKYLYIPGIYDSVELILSGEPRIVNIQAVPDIDAQSVRVIAELQSSTATSCSVTCEVREAKSGTAVGMVQQSDVAVGGEGVTKVDIVVPLESCRLWTPEDPFLYKLKLSTGADTAETRFGMRSFRFDRASGRAVLNGKPYFMRGTNVCAYRFFEDAERGDRPWRKDWVRRLHREVQEHALELDPLLHRLSAGILVRHRRRGRLPDPGRVPDLDAGRGPGEGRGREDRARVHRVDAGAVEPSVRGDLGRSEREHTPETGKALSAVRHLDLSNRPWDNGWAEPQSEADCVESHPYL